MGNSFARLGLPGARHGAGMLVVACVACVTGIACALDSSGLGSSAGSIGSAGSRATSEGSDGDAEVSGETQASGEASGESDDPSTTTTTPPGETSTGDKPDPTDDGGDHTTGVDPCSAAPPFQLALDANQAVLAGSMAKGGLFDGKVYVYGETAADGSASFAIDLPCTDEYMVWAEVYDAEPGPLDLPLYASDPGDAFEVEIGGIVTEWLYGCQWDVFDTWGTLAVSTSPDCLSNDKVVMSLVAGQHTLTITPLEGGAHAGGLSPGSVAALSRVIITNDLENAP